MLTQNCPFVRADTTDRNYKLISMGEWAEFWNTHSKFNGPAFKFSEDFKDLFSKMVDPNPKRRLTLSQIKEHRWFKGILPTQNDIAQIFTTKSESCKNLTKSEKKNLQKSINPNMVSTTTSKSPTSKQKKENRLYTKYFNVKDGDELVNKIVSFANKNNYKYKK